MVHYFLLCLFQWSTTKRLRYALQIASVRCTPRIRGAQLFAETIAEGGRFFWVCCRSNNSRRRGLVRFAFFRTLCAICSTVMRDFTASPAERPHGWPQVQREWKKSAGRAKNKINERVNWDSHLSDWPSAYLFFLKLKSSTYPKEKCIPYAAVTLVKFQATIQCSQ